MDVTPMLQAQGISLRFGGFQALADVDVGFAPGRITGLIGPNGAGKSTLLNVLGGTLRPDHGDVLLQGRSIARAPVHRRAALGLTRSFQITRELNSLSVLENVLLAGRPQRDGVIDALFRPGRTRRRDAELIERARTLLERVGLWRLADAQAGALSGGQKKLLELVRALFTEPKVVLLDEPAAGVNPLLVSELAEHILAINRDQGVTFGIVEHNMDMISTLCDHVYVLAAGRVLTHGRFADVTAHPEVAEAYLGAVH